MSKIEWTEQTWNPVVGCSIVSPGCTNCYAMRMAARIEAMKRSHYDGTTKRVNGNPVWTGKVALAPDHILLEPLRRKKPTLWFVNSMGDLFHEDAPDEWIDRVFAVMALCPQHTFQVLTKRAERMRKYFQVSDRTRWHYIDRAVSALASAQGWREFGFTWPLPNLWLGVSAERQKEADERIPHLLATPAAVRFISAEPLLGPINLKRIQISGLGFRGIGWQDVLSGWRDCNDYPGRENVLDWVICGGESGPSARPMHPQWARDLRDQCEAAGVLFFFKQWGAWAPDTKARDRMIVDFGGGVDIPDDRAADERSGEVEMVCRSKAVSGRTLDGKIHDAMPGPMQREAM